ncbi:hypothetical protein B0H67DRAFT_558327 [Lasiosphaeris hirsuta]|uniref:Uncharacterized protein n=1 Tax=Lasiosphaeris hirsuta TaxID=260670 RepID=A0AA40DJ65_9PEZI|nr:hypothetical protein B0H67DRAFT_558327 [Lasiosphaeris hirsuta]
MPSKASILDTLSGECPAIDATRTKPGTNTTSTYWPDVDTWTRWGGFNAQDLYKRYQPIVDAEWASGVAGSADPSSWDTRVFDEDSLEHYLSKFLLPHVNTALGHACHVLGMDKNNDLDVGRGGRCYYGGDTTRLFKPDWSLCSDSQTQGSKLYKNLLPGDTKLAMKWRSSMYKTAAHYAWKDPVRQILYYMKEVGVRYGWLITDAELVVLRVSVELTGPGQAIDRPKRQPCSTLGHSRMSSTETDVSHLSSALQGTSLNNSLYAPPDNGVEAYHVEYQTIPWENSGHKSQLSIRLALFYLAMMAGYGARSLLPAYPAFDSCWWCDSNADLFVHNTTGIPSKIPHNLEHPNPTGQRGPAFTSETGRPEKFLTRASVQTLDIDLQRQQPYYDVEESDEQGKMVTRRIFVDDNVTIYDADTAQYGRLQGLRWVPEVAGSGDSREGKRPSEGPSGSDKRHKK